MTAALQRLNANSDNQSRDAELRNQGLEVMIAQLASAVSDSRRDIAELTNAVSNSRREAEAERARFDRELRETVDDSHQGLLAVIAALLQTQRDTLLVVRRRRRPRNKTFPRPLLKQTMCLGAPIHNMGRNT